MSDDRPTLADVLAARRFLEPYLRPTPLVQRPAVNEALGVPVWLKCENLLPTAAFKVRGGLNLVGRDPTAKKGVYSASTGNHGQSIAYAGKVFGVPVTIFVPPGAPTQMRSLPRSKTSVGVIIVTRVLPGWIELGVPGRGSKQFM